jgi:hypothetical protein
MGDLAYLPSIADFFYLLGYPLFLAGFFHCFCGFRRLIRLGTRYAQGFMFSHLLG